MQIDQRDVYLLPYPLGEGDPHLFVVLSCHEANANENTFLAAMITSSTIYKDELSFLLTDEMFEQALKKGNSHVRCHLIMLCLNKEIIGGTAPVNRMKNDSFVRLMKHVGEMVFSYEFNPL